MAFVCVTVTVVLHPVYVEVSGNGLGITRQSSVDVKESRRELVKA